MHYSRDTNVLIIGGWIDQAFTFVRSFSRHEHIHLYLADCWPNSPSRYSRYCEGFFLIPHQDSPSYASAILEVCQSEQIDVLLPLGHEDIIQVAKHQDLFRSAGIRLPIPSAALIEYAMDKYKLALLAEEKGLSVPATYLLSGIELGKIADTVGFPLLIKLRYGTGQRGQGKVSDMAELEIHVQSLLGEYTEDEIVLQEYVPGNVRDTMYTVGLVYDDQHQLKTCVPLSKIRSRPYTGGTALCTRAENHPGVAALATGIMDAFEEWVGITDVEIKLTPEGKPTLIEVNPRPWGSMYGTYVAGVDFPLLWVMVAMGEDFEPITEFKEGIYASFLGRDLLLLRELLGKVFSDERSAVAKVVKSYVYPYLRRGGKSDTPATPDFILEDLAPFRRNTARLLKRRSG